MSASTNSNQPQPTQQPPAWQLDRTDPEDGGNLVDFAEANGRALAACTAVAAKIGVAD